MESKEIMLAKELLGIKAVLLRPDQPFTWASGWHSPIYCDNRRILSEPALRSRVAGWLAEIAMEKYPEAEVVAGVATGAIAHGVLAADKMQKPFVYVRPKPKDHGTGSQIEGVLPQGAKVVVIEDLISTGMSSLAAVKALRDAGAEVLGMVAIFTYGFPVAAEQFAAAGVALDTVSNYDALIDVATATGYVRPSDTDVLKQWRKNPSEWMATEITSKHGIVSKQPFELYMAFVDMRNFLQFLPEDRKKDIAADYDTISASVQGMNVGVKINERVPYSKIGLVDNGAPFAFSGSLHFDAVPSDPGKTEFYIEFSAELNFMMKMLLGNKLKDALDKIVDGLAAMSEGRMPEGVDEQTLKKMQEEMMKRQG